MTAINRKKARGNKHKPSRGERIKNLALKAGAAKLFILSTVLSIGVAVLVHYSYVSPQNTINDGLSKELAQKRQQNAVARLVQETKPDFLQQFRRVINNFTTARELLPGEAEVSNVLDSIQQMANSNGIRVTMFDASKPGAKSTNPVAQNQTTATSDPSQPQVTLNERVIPAQIQGPHAAVVRFLSALAKYPRIIYVRDFSITSLNRQESVNLTLVTYDAPTSGILPPIPAELRDEFQSQHGSTATLLSK